MPLFQVDAFTRTPFAGNPAGVFVARSFPADDWMQALAAEMNLSETAFVVPKDTSSDPAVYALRWFTPTDEVDLCGHATLASAHVIFAEWNDADRGDGSGPDAVVFETASGPLTVRETSDGALAMDFPADAPSEIPPPDGLLEALGLDEAVFVGKGDRDILVRASDAGAVERCAPDMKRLVTFDARGVIVTAEAPADMDDADFVSRFFAPAVGVPEDPVTGSAHCALAPYWAAQIGTSTLTGRQLSARGGRVGVDTSTEGRITLTGHAVTIFGGELSDAALHT